MILCGDCIEEMAKLEDESVDTLVSDPPAGINFMGKSWDHKAGYDPRTERGAEVLSRLDGLLEPWAAGFASFTVDWSGEAYRLLKPGAMALVWALPRTQDLTQMGLRLAGYEIRDAIGHLFGSGFPKSHNISVAIDKRAGAEREVVGVESDVLTRPITPKWSTSLEVKNGGGPFDTVPGHLREITAPATDEARLWDGYGTALKPAYESWILAMKPLDGTFANNALRHGVAGLWIDGGRVSSEGYTSGGQNKTVAFQKGELLDAQPRCDGSKGRFPANLILSHAPGCECVGEKRVKSDGHWSYKADQDSDKYSGHWPDKEDLGNIMADADGMETVAEWVCQPGCPIAELDRQSGMLSTHAGTYKPDYQSNGKSIFGVGCGGSNRSRVCSEGDKGGASRFFPNLPGEASFRYVAKASRAERNQGVEYLFWKIDKSKPSGVTRIWFQEWEFLKREEWRIFRETGRKVKSATEGNIHATVKPLALMRYLVRLTRTPTGGVVLDPFMGSGTTGIACILEGREFIGIEQDPDYFEIARRRIASVEAPPITLDHFGGGHP